MSATEALKAARAAGISLGVDGEALTLTAAAAPPPDVLKLLSSHKAGVIELLRPARDGWSLEDWLLLFDERAGIAELHGGLTRDEAEARSLDCCVAETAIGTVHLPVTASVAQRSNRSRIHYCRSEPK
jgi:hypothetical protein